MSGLELLYVILLMLCLVLSAFFSSSEVAFFSLQRFRLEHMVSSSVAGSGRVARIVQRPEKLLSVVLLGNNLVNTAAAALGTALAVIFLPEETGVVVATVVVTLLLLVFSETTPKTLANRHAEKASLLLARPLSWFMWLLGPLVVVLSWIASGLGKIFGGEPVPRSLVSDEEIKAMISAGHKEGSVEESEAEMLHKVFDFGDRPVREAMIPRTEVVWVEKGTRLADFLKVYAETPLSRFPIFEENMDRVVGILAVKDVLMALARKKVSEDSPVDGLIRPAYFTPETKRISELFGEMRDKNYRVAVVVDEYGGTAGIVSLSGLVEEIVGPVGDEFAEAEKEYEAIDERTFQVDGGMRIEEANEEMGLGLPEGEYETVAGFILDLLGYIPKMGQRLKYQDLRIAITEMRGLKIESIRVTREKPSEEAAKGETGGVG
jgi:putative hemolysin